METHAGSQEHKTAQRVVCHTFIYEGVPHTAPVRTAKTSAACQEDGYERECTPARQCGRNGLDIGSQQCSRQGRRQRWAHVPAVLMLLWVGAPSIAQPPTPEISTLTPHAGHAAGGYSVTIGGHGFVIDGSATYMCTFACKSLSVSTAARVLSGANVTCPVPLWTAAPCPSSVAVLQTRPTGAPVVLNGTALTFNLTAAWITNDPRAGPASGGGSIEVQGAGFSDTAVHTCVFSGRALIFGETLTTTAIRMSPTRLICPSPRSNLTLAWSMEDMKASLSVEADGAVLQFAGSNPTKREFTYTMSSWSSATPGDSHTRGGLELNVVGHGFKAGAHKYVASFLAGQYDASSSCTVVSESQLMCPIPAWDYGEMSVSLNILRDGVAIGKSGAQFLFQFFATWESVEGANFAFVTNGGSIKVHGTGFALASTGLRYVLEFRGQVPVALNASGPLPVQYSEEGAFVGTQRKQLVFTLPDWTYPEQSAMIYLHRSVAGHVMSEVIFTGSPVTAQLQWYSVWKEARLLYSYNMPVAVPTAPGIGGGQITIFGIGFRESYPRHVCRFTCEDRNCTLGFVDTVPTIRDSSVLICPSPLWVDFGGQGARVVSLSLWKGSQPLRRQGGHKFYLTITRASVTSRAEAYQQQYQGDQLITITGEGFCYLKADADTTSCLNMYKCQLHDPLRVQDMAIAKSCLLGGNAGERCDHDAQCDSGQCSDILSIDSAPARIVNDSAVLCAMPQWPFPDANASIVLYDVSFVSQMLPVGSISSASFLSYRSLILEPSFSAVGASGDVIVFNSHFDSVEDYQCRFVMHGLQLQGIISRVSTRAISCQTPVWPRGMPASQAELSLLLRNTAIPSITGLPVYIQVRSQLLGIGVANCDRFNESLSAGSFDSRASLISNLSSVEACMPEAPASGGFHLELYTWGIDPTVRHHCQLTGANGNFMTAEVVIKNSSRDVDRVFISSLPRWPFDAALVNVSLTPSWATDDSDSLMTFNLPVQLNLVQQVESVEDAQWFEDECHARGSSTSLGPCFPLNITVSGAGFQSQGQTQVLNRGDYSVLHWRDYACKMVQIGGSLELHATFVSVPSPSKLICRFDYDEIQNVEYGGSTNFTLDLSFSTMQLPVDQHVAVRLSETWFSFECQDVNCRTPASGGRQVSVEGAGFSSLASYFCNFSNGVTSALSPAATWLSPSELLCSTPEWPFGEDRTFLTLVMDTVHGKTIVAKRGAWAAPTIFFHAVWWLRRMVKRSVFGGSEDSTLAEYPGTFEPVNGTLDVVGRGFHVRTLYYARFQGVAGDGSQLESYTSPANPIGPSELRVVVPAFEGREGRVNVEIFKCDPSDACPASQSKQAGFLIDAERGRSPAHPSGLVVSSFIYSATWATISAPTLGDVVYADKCYPHGWTECWSPAGQGTKLLINGAGFFGGISYLCRFTSTDDPAVVNETQAVVLNEFTLLCITSVLQRAGRYEVELESSVAGEVPRLSTFASTLVSVVPSISMISPSSGPSSAASLTVFGRSFARAGSLVCQIWSPNATGYAWLQQQRISVPAQVLGQDKLKCEVGGRWGKLFPAGPANIDIEAAQATARLAAIMTPTQAHLNARLDTVLTGGFDEIVLAPGQYFRVDDEIILLTLIKNNSTWVVTRGMRGSVKTSHDENASVFAIAFQTASTNFVFEPAMTGVSQHEAFAAGGEKLHVFASGLNGTLLQFDRLLQPPPSCNASAVSDDALAVLGSGGYQGVAFDVFARRRIVIRGFDFRVTANSSHDIVLLARKRDLCAGAAVCSSVSFESNLNAWEVLSTASGFSGGSSDQSWPKDASWVMEAGTTHGFMILSTGILSRGRSGACSAWQDDFLSLSAGPEVVGNTRPDGSLSDIARAGSSAPTVLRGGAVRYDNTEILGDVYRCRWRSATGNQVLSAPVRAFLPKDTHTFSASSVQCKIPSWSAYPASDTWLTLQNLVSDTEIDFGSHGDEVSAAQTFTMRESWSSLLPSRGDAIGGTILYLNGYSFVSGAEYACRFRSLSVGAEIQAPATVLNQSTAYCQLPYLNNSSLLARIDLLRNGTPIAWTPAFSEWTDSNSCWDPSCDAHSLKNVTLETSFPSCWNFPCSFQSSNHTESLSGRTFDIVDHLSTQTVQPKWGPAKGGTKVLVPGYGFDGNAKYLCAFEDGGNGILVEALVSRAPEIISCHTPVWGNTFAAVNYLSDQNLPQVFRVYKSMSNQTSVDAIMSSHGGIQVTVNGTFPLRPVNYARFEDEWMAIDSVTASDHSNEIVLSVARRGAFNSVALPHPPSSAVEFLTEIQGVSQSSGASNFSFITEWNVYAKSPPMSSDDFNITFQGFGFNTQAQYYFVMSSATATVTSQESFPISPTKLFLKSTAWQGEERETNLTLYQSGDPIAVCSTGDAETCTGTVLLSGFDTSWRSISQKRILARGGESVTVIGMGFQTSRSYTCVFSGTRHNYTSTATTVTPDRVICVSPVWPAAAETVRLTLFQDDGTPVPFVGVSDNQDLIYVQGLETFSIDGSAANVAISSGGVDVVISGYGLHAPSQDYVCRISANGNSMSSPATSTTSTTLRCTLPAWGFHHEADRVKLEVFQLVFGSSLTLPVTFMSDGSTPYPCTYGGMCMVDMIPVLTDVVAPSSGSCNGGALMRWGGAGFHPNGVYTCHFAYMHETATSTASAANHSSIQCVSPRWPFGAKQVSITVLDSQGSPIMKSGLAASRNAFTYKEEWVSKDVSAGPAAGGSMVTLAGDGFNVFEHYHDALVNYKCVFCLALECVSSHADTISHNQVVCLTPQWPFAAANVQFSVQKAMDDNGAANVLDYEGGPDPQDADLFFEFREGVVGVLGHSTFSAAGELSSMPNIVQVQGFGFIQNASDYVCSFAFKSYNSSAVVISHNLMQCAVPAIGLVEAIGGKEDGLPVVSLQATVAILHSGILLDESNVLVAMVSTWYLCLTNGGFNRNVLSTGGQTIIVRGSGFALDLYYYCVLEDAQGNYLFSKPTGPINATTVECVTKQWLRGVAYVSMALEVSAKDLDLPSAETMKCVSATPGEWTDSFGYFCSDYDVFAQWCGLDEDGVSAAYHCCECGGGHDIDTAPRLRIHYDGKATPEPFYMTAMWSTRSPSAGPSKGGSTVTVVGNGFGSNTSTLYSCVFDNISVPASVVNNTILKCNSPTVPFPRSSTFSVFDSFGNKVGKSNNDEIQLFSFLSGWISFSPRSGSSSGGDIIVFEAYALNLSTNHECVFIGSNGENLTSVATLPNATTAMCSTPSWGVKFAAGDVTVQLRERGEGAESVKVDDRFAVSSRFEFQLMWTPSSFQLSGPTAGGTNISLSGFGFRASTSARCVFELPAYDEYNVSSNLLFDDTSPNTFAKCTVPPWPYGVLGTTPGIISLFLHFDTFKSGPQRFEYYVQQFWTEKSVAVAPAKGGTVVKVKGEGLNISHVHLYQCRFNLSSQGIDEVVNASVENSTLLYCVAPKWKHAAANTSFSVSTVVKGVRSEVDFQGVSGNARLFTFTECWEGFKETTALASVSDAVLLNITTYGIHSHLQHQCSFNRGTDSMTTMAVVMNSALIRCPVPKWGTRFAAGAVTLDLVRDQSISIIHTGSALPEILFYEMWSPASLGITSVPAAGPLSIVVPAFGFRGDVQYVCWMRDDAYSSHGYNGYQTRPGNVTVTNATSVLCELPGWNHSATYAATLLIAESNGSNVRTTESIEGYLMVTDGFWSIHPTQASAVGNSTLTVNGFGFSNAKVYTCRFKNVTTTAQVSSPTLMLCPVPTWHLNAQKVNFSLSLGSRPVRLASRGQSTEIVYADSRTSFQFYHEWRMHKPDFIDRLGDTNSGFSPSVTITGFGFSRNGLYRSAFDVPGLVNTTRYSEPCSAQGNQFDFQTLVCQPPVWDANSSWGEFKNRDVRMRLVFEHGHNSEVVAPVQGTLAPGMGKMRVVDINKHPDFEAKKQVWVYRSPDVGIDEAYFFRMDGWAYDLRQGVFQSGIEAQTESAQQLSFSISFLDGDWPDLYAVKPAVFPNGTLQFTVSPNRFGNTNLVITLQDSGGTSFNGHDSVTKTVQINVLPRHSSLFSSDVVQVQEDAGLVVLTHFISDALHGRIGDHLNIMTFEVNAEAVYYTQPPRIDATGTLSLQTAPFVFGNTTMSIHVVEKNVAGEITAHLDYNITLQITAVNSAPTFNIMQGMHDIVVFENVLEYNRQFADPSSIFAGANRESCSNASVFRVISSVQELQNCRGPKGELWGESDQALSFNVVDSSPLFAQQPRIDPVTGNLSFTLLPHLHGNVTFQVYLEDDGGNVSLPPGPLRSDIQTLIIQILPINDQPIFGVNCNPTLANQQQFTCLGDCESTSLTNCSFQIRLDENCVNCQHPSDPLPGCPKERSFTIHSLIPLNNLLASKWGAQYELEQEMTFFLNFVNGTESIFRQAPSISSVTGNLAFCVADDRHGGAQYSVTLKDNGGTSFGGVDSFGAIPLLIKVYSVNQHPSFAFCSGRSCGNLQRNCCSNNTPAWKWS